MIPRPCNPRLCWVNTNEVEPGYIVADLDEVLHVPGQKGYIGRGLQVVHGNYMRGRPHFLDTLNIWYLDDFETDRLPVNASLHGSPDAVCADGLGEYFWKGPIVVHLKAGNEFDAKKMKDITLTAYRDAVDYLAYYRDTIGSMIDQGERNDKLGQRVMTRRTGKVKGVRINCIGDQARNSAREFVQVDVPRAHPLFMLEGDDPLDIAQNFYKNWVTYRYAGYKDTTEEEAQNVSGKLLQLAVSEDWLTLDCWGTVPRYRLRYTTGSLLIVDRGGQDLDVRMVQAACRLMKEQVMPLLERGSEVQREKVLDALKLEALEQFT